MHAERVALLARQQRLLPLPDHPHRPPRLPHQRRQVGLDGHVLLAAEAAAHERRDHPHPAVGQRQDVGELARVLDHLCGHAQRDHAVGVDPADAGLGLQVGVVDARGLIRLLHDLVGARHRLIDVPDRRAPGHVAVAARVHGGSAVAQRGVGVEHAVGILVLDLDERRRLDRGARALGGDDGDRLAVITDPVDGQHRLHDLVDAEPRGLLGDHVVRDVGRGEHGTDPPHLARRRDVDAGDQGARHVGAHDNPVQHAREAPVVGVREGPGYLLHEVAVRHAAGASARRPRRARRSLSRHRAPGGEHPGRPRPRRGSWCSRCSGRGFPPARGAAPRGRRPDGDRGTTLRSGPSRACRSRTARRRGRGRTAAGGAAPRRRASPRTVVTSQPSACTANIRQALTGSPSSSTVHVPHTPSPQPSLTSGAPASTRSSSSRDRLGLTQASVRRPLTCSETGCLLVAVMPAPAARRRRLGAGRGRPARPPSPGGIRRWRECSDRPVPDRRRSG